MGIQDPRRAVSLSTLLVFWSVTIAAGGPVGAAAAQGSAIQIVSMELPEKMVPGEEYQTRVRYRNTGDSAASVEVSYEFEGERSISMNEILAAGESKSFQVRISLSDAQNSMPERLYDGTYEHGFQIGDVQAAREVVVEGLGTPTPTATPLSNVETVTETETRDRSFTPGPGVPTPVGSDGPVRIAKADFPDRLALDGSASVFLQLRNTADERVSVPVQYVFDDVASPMIVSEEELDAGETKTVEIRIRGDDLDRAFDGLRPGQYPHGIVVPGDEVRESVDIVEAGGRSDDRSTDGDRQRVAAGDSRTDAPPQRGFFTNGEPQFAFVDSFTLTVGGFMLSALGILHQMMQG